MKDEQRMRMEKLANEHSLDREELKLLLEERDEEAAEILAEYAAQQRQSIYGTDVYVRGLIELSNYCKNDCFYCGIRKSNPNCDRYRLTKEDILECCKEGYELGFRTFVLQGGEDPYLTDKRLCELVKEIKKQHPDCAITLSLGERTKDSYQKLKEAGADRYLLRHETASKAHYESLHPKELSFENRMECLRTLKELGYQVGCGFMVGSPGQTIEELVEDLLFIKEFQPDMCGIGPFIPHKDTPLGNKEAGGVDLTCYLLSVVRLLVPHVLLPATTALGTMDPYGREKGILAGANVVMPNLSPQSVRKKYSLYDNKISDGAESAQCLDSLKKRMEAIGYEVVCHRGDVLKEE